MKSKWSIIVPILCIGITIAFGATVQKSVILTNFNSGELSPQMEGRADFTKYRSGARELQNMIVRSQGPVTRRPGTKYIAEVKDSNDPTRMMPFEYSSSDAYAIEGGDDYLRFYRNGAQVTSDGNAYEIVSPWDANDIFELQFTQDAQYMRIVHPDYPPYKLTRNSASHTDWTLSKITFSDGPFLDENETKASTISADAVTGDVNLTTTAGIWDEDHVGALWQITHMVDSNAVSGTFNGPWTQYSATGVEEIENSGEGGITIDGNSVSLLVYEHQTYTVTTGGDWSATFKIQRSYDDGTTWNTVKSFTYVLNGNILYTGTEEEADALYRVRIESQYVNSHMMRHGEGECAFTLATDAFLRHGVVLLTAVTDANTAAGTVQTDLASTDATWRWAEGAWSDYRGWPRTIEHHEQRCLYGGSTSYPQVVWASVTSSQDGDYDDFDAGLGDAADAWTYVLPGLSPIQWMKSAEYLMIGTTEGVGRLGLPDKPMDPTWPPAYRLQARNGAAYIDAVAAIDAILYVERGAQRVREVMYTYSSDRYIAPDMSIMAEHIGREGIVQIDFQERPDPILWAVRADGVLLSFTYQRQHEVLAWARHITGQDPNDMTSWDDFESVCVIPGGSSRADGTTRVDDEVWAIVNRTVDSNSVRYVEQFQSLDWGDDPNYCWFVDCALNGSSAGSTDLTQGSTMVSSYPTLQELTAEEIPATPAIPADTALSGEISVTDAAGLQAMTPGNHYSIDNDIDMTGVVWTPLDFDSASGIVIEGNNNTISNLTLSTPAGSEIAFISSIDDVGRCEIRNLTFEDCSFTGANYVAVLVGDMKPHNDNCRIKNVNFTGCTVAHTTAGSSAGYIGVLAGDVYGKENIYISDCAATDCNVTVTASAASNIGGLLGAIWNSGSLSELCVEDCNVVGGTMTITSADIEACAGFVGIANMLISTTRVAGFYDCNTSMDIVCVDTSATGDITAIGGFFGYVTNVACVDCSATGDITISSAGLGGSGEEFSNIGGFLGQSSCNETYTNCYCTGAITFTDEGDAPLINYVGGYAGYVDYDFQLLRCYSTSAIVVETEVGDPATPLCFGGFAGRVYTQNATSTFERCWCEGDITFEKDVGADTGWIAGFIGAITIRTGVYAVDVLNCYSWTSIVMEGSYNADLTLCGFVCSWPNVADLTFVNAYDAQTDSKWGSSYTAQIPTGNDSHGFGGDDANDAVTKTAVYFDQTTSSITDDDIALAKTTDWLQTQANFEAAGWDFDDIWVIDSNGTVAGPNEWSGATQAGGLVECVYADGRPIGTFTVDANGVLDLGADYDIVIAGLNYFSILETMPLIDMETIGRPTTIMSFAIDYIESMGAHVGSDMDYAADQRFSDDAFATSILPYTGYKPTMGYSGFLRGTSRQPVIYIYEWDPIPMTIRSITANLKVTFE